MSLKIKNEKGEWVEIPSIKGEGGSNLPTVTEKDEGKFLTVQGGKWSAQENEDCKPLTNLEIEKLLHNFT